jgi:DNA polymerase elongation subunit (family B)
MTEYENLTIDEIDAEIEKLEMLYEKHDNMQMALKIFINSAYGATANQYFAFYNLNVAESITLQGQDLLKNTRIQANKYASEKWHLDTKLHEKLGIEDVVKIQNPQKFSIYCDTDSWFFNNELLMKSGKYEGDPIEFVMNFDKHRLSGFFDKWHDSYAKRFGVKNIQEFEFEKLSYNAIWVSKKNYTLNLAMKDGEFFKKFDEVVYTGIKVVRSETPAWVKDRLIDFILLLYKNDGDVKYNDLISLVMKWKTEYPKVDINQIAELRGISDYNKNVVSDLKGTALTLKKGTPMHVRAAANYNYYLNNNVKYKKKYDLLHSGDKVRYYVSKPNYDLPDDVFGFIINQHPYEFAPEFDYSTMFNKWIINSLNAFLKAMDYKLIPENLTKVKRLF